MPLKSYYPGATPERDGIVLMYESQGPMSITEYWYVRQIERKVITLILDGQFQLRQRVVEKIADDGVNIEALTLWQDNGDDIKEVQVEIHQNDVFPYDPMDSTYAYITEYAWMEDSITPMRLYKNRRYVGSREVTNQGKAYNAVVFQIEERIENDRDGSLVIETSGEEYYVADVGQVRRIKRISPELMLDIYLKDVLTMEGLKSENKKLHEAIVYIENN